MKEALYYEKVNSKIRCYLCPHQCLIKENALGICGVRQNYGDKLITLNYGRYSSINLDPVEKKPLYHFYPGKNILSIGTIGCNFQCPFCQNWSISQVRKTRKKETKSITKEELIKIAIDLKEKGNIGIAYTYNEPFIWYEFVRDCAQFAKAEGLKNVLVTNGYVNLKPLEELLPYIDAVNIDIKSMREEFYLKLCKGKLEPVLKTCETAYKKCLIEITNLIIPNHNDQKEDFEKLVNWIIEHMGDDAPLHFSRYHPDYQFNETATPIETLSLAYKIAKEKLKYVYIGNILDDFGENTYCPNCGKMVIERSGFKVNQDNLNSQGMCNFCGYQILKF
ncbi:MAG: AmmeMemoRadiSam system radical SAM enzyme [Armatimonadetes bacterium]|nr:AmmeMemoRadiSam system radical SAM enzyme [Armatimonadota bacterium]